MRSFTASLLAVASLSLSTTVAKSIPRSNTCGVAGYDSQTDAYFYDDSGKYASYSKCSDHCIKDSKCQSFGYDTTAVCMHFNVPVTGNVVQDKSSHDIYYDRGCVATSTSPYSTMSTSTVTGVKNTQTTKSTTLSSTTTLITTTAKSATSKTVSSTTTLTLSTNLNGQRTSTSTSSKSSSSSSTAKIATTSGSTATTTGTSTSTAKLTTFSSNTSKTTAATSSGTSKTTAKSSSTSSTVAVPSGCDIPAAYTITNFSWFNSTHNLDCATGPDLGDGTGCIKSDSSGATVWCNPQTDNACTSCGINVCSTGLPPQPLGYGPPDVVNFAFSDGRTCQQLNPAVVHRYEVGNGYVNCGSSADFMNFYGSSNDATNVGRVEINGYMVQCADGQTIIPYYNTNFDIQCTRDAEKNATCSTSASFQIPLVRFTKA